MVDVIPLDALAFREVKLAEWCFGTARQSIGFGHENPRCFEGQKGSLLIEIRMMAECKRCWFVAQIDGFQRDFKLVFA